VLTLPALSPTMKQGKIVNWNFKVGDEVGPGDVVADIETDKSNVGYEVQEDGYIAAIFLKTGESADIGKPMFIIVSNKSDVASFTNYDPNATASTTPVTSAPSPTPAPTNTSTSTQSQVNYPRHQVLTMPSLSPTMKEGKILKWNFKEGDAVDSGDVLAEIETDKSTVGYEIQESGFVAKILLKGTGAVALGDPIAIVVDDKNDIAAFANYTGPVVSHQSTQVDPAQTANTTQNIAQPTSSGNTNTSGTSKSGDRVFITPQAKNTLISKGIDLASASQIKGTGPRGRIVQKDVENMTKASLKTTQVSTTATKSQ
jgi:pyruvate dehydrogenase E2 component (dihydrolipoamide acetyltransferase)